MAGLLIFSRLLKCVLGEQALVVLIKTLNTDAEIEELYTRHLTCPGVPRWPRLPCAMASVVSPVPQPKSRTLSLGPRAAWTLVKSLAALVLITKWAWLDFVYWDGVTNFIDVDENNFGLSLMFARDWTFRTARIVLFDLLALKCCVCTVVLLSD